MIWTLMFTLRWCLAAVIVYLIGGVLAALVHGRPILDMFN